MPRLGAKNYQLLMQRAQSLLTYWNANKALRCAIKAAANDSARFAWPDYTKIHARCVEHARRIPTDNVFCSLINVGPVTRRWRPSQHMCASA